MKTARLAVFCVSLIFLAHRSVLAADLGTPVDFADFTALVEGDYQIIAVNGDAPKSENADGSIVSEDEDVVFTFGYCHNGPCDAGYLIFPKKPDGMVKVYDKELDTKAHLYTIVHKDGLDTYTYELEIPADKKEHSLLRRFNYVYNGNPPVTLVHEIQKK